MFKNTVAVLRWCGSFLLCIIIWYYCKFKTFFHHRKIWLQTIHFCLLCVRNTFSINTWFLFLFVCFFFCFCWAALNPFIPEVWMSDNSPQRQFAQDDSPLTLTQGNLHMIVLFEQHAPPAFAHFQTLGQIVWGELSLGRVVQIPRCSPLTSKIIWCSTE